MNILGVTMRHFNLPTSVYNKVAGDMHVRAINQVCSADYVPNTWPACVWLQLVKKNWKSLAQPIGYIHA